MTNKQFYYLFKFIQYVSAIAILYMIYFIIANVLLDGFILLEYLALSFIFAQSTGFRAIFAVKSRCFPHKKADLREFRGLSLKENIKTNNGALVYPGLLFHVVAFSFPFIV